MVFVCVQRGLRSRQPQSCNCWIVSQAMSLKMCFFLIRPLFDTLHCMVIFATRILSLAVWKRPVEMRNRCDLLTTFRPPQNLLVFTWKVPCDTTGLKAAATTHQGLNKIYLLLNYQHQPQTMGTVRLRQLPAASLQRVNWRHEMYSDITQSHKLPSAGQALGKNDRSHRQLRGVDARHQM